MNHSGGTVEGQRAQKNVDSGGPAGEVSAGSSVRVCSCYILSATLNAFSSCFVILNGTEIKN